jgi:hypothetical protein
MPTLHAGIDPKTGKPRIVDLTEGQMQQLGFKPKEKPKKLGCGDSGCAYQPQRADAIVKITKDDKEARAAHLLMHLPTGTPAWAVPIYAVYRLAKHTYAICTAKAEKLPRSWVTYIEAIYQYTEDEDIAANEWQSVYDGYKREIQYSELEHGGPNEDDKLMRRTLELINDVVLDFRKLGLDWGDFHSYNWMLYSGRPVVIDFGMTPQAFLSEVEYPALKEIPILPY